MGRQWVTLILVVVGAAIAGWSTVHLLDQSEPVRVAVEPAAVATAPPPEPTAVATVTPRPVPSPAAPAPTVEEPPAAEGDDESAIIVRDLAALAQALVRDQRIEDNVMPRVNDILDIPGATEYRRVPDFWEPALGEAEQEPNQ